MIANEEKSEQNQNVHEFAGSFDELFNKHIAWITGKFNGSGYMTSRKLKDIEGNDDFIKLLANISKSCKIIITESQPPKLKKLKILIENDPFFVDPSNKKYNIYRRGYIKGLVNIETFWKIFKQDQKDLIIIGRLPFISYKNNELSHSEQNLYNISKINDNCSLYIKNINKKNIDIYDIFSLMKYKKKSCKHNKFFVYRLISYYLYTFENKYFIEAVNRLKNNETTWKDHELCEIYIIHPKYNVDQKIFEDCVYNLCKNIN